MTPLLQDEVNDLGAWVIPLAGCVAFTIFRFLCSPYFIWKQEHEARIEENKVSAEKLLDSKEMVEYLKAKLDDRAALQAKKEASENFKLILAGYLDAARILQNRCIDKLEIDEVIDGINKWNEEADAYLRTIGAVYQMRFRNDSGIQPGLSRNSFMSNKHLHAWTFLHCRMCRLDEFLKENIEPGLDSLMHQRFDP